MTKSRKWIFGVITSAIFISTVGGLMSQSEFNASLKPENESLVLNESNSHQNIKPLQQPDKYQSKIATDDKVEAHSNLVLTLLGVMANDNGGGFALIEVDGKPAQPFAKGDKVSTGFVIQSIGHEQVGLAERPGQPVIKTLRLQHKKVIESSLPIGVAQIQTATATTMSLAGSAVILSQNTTSNGPPPRADSRYKPSGPSRRHDASFYKVN